MHCKVAVKIIQSQKPFTWNYGIIALKVLKMCVITYTNINLILYHKPEHCTTGGQGDVWQDTLFNEHVWLVKHPPLSISQDGSQYVWFVGSNTLHCEPLGHTISRHSIKIITRPYTSLNSVHIMRTVETYTVCEIAVLSFMLFDYTL